MLKRFAHLFRESTDSKLTDRLIGENALLELVSARGLGAEIAKTLRHLEDWPFDLRDASFDPQEQVLLSLWGFSAAVLHGVTVAADRDKREFLDRFHRFYFHCLTAGDLAPITANRLLVLTGERYPEYEVAFMQMRQLRAVHALIPHARLARLITFHLLGRETDDLMVSTTIGICLATHFNSFESTFNSAHAWALMQSAIRD